MMMIKIYFRDEKKHTQKQLLNGLTGSVVVCVLDQFNFWLNPTKVYKNLCSQLSCLTFMYSVHCAASTVCGRQLHE